MRLSDLKRGRRSEPCGLFTEFRDNGFVIGQFTDERIPFLHRQILYGNRNGEGNDTR